MDKQPDQRLAVSWENADDSGDDARDKARDHRD
jgi:hypothetical protein